MDELEPPSPTGRAEHSTAPSGTPGRSPGRTPGDDTDTRPAARRDDVPDANDPPRNTNYARDHLANERTLLAWSRTAIAVMGLGFVVARFGLLIRELGGRLSPGLPTGTSTALGTALVLIGAVLLALALMRYLRSGRAIDAGKYVWSPLLGALLVGCLLLVGVLLAIYLVVTA